MEILFLAAYFKINMLQVVPIDLYSVHKLTLLFSVVLNYKGKFSFKGKLFNDSRQLVCTFP